MSKLKVFVLFTAFSISAPYALADEAEMKELIRKLESRVEVLENKLQQQDKCITEQNACIEEHRKKIVDYEAQINKMDEQLHREVGAPTFVKEGFRVGAGATMIVQGTNNTNAGEEKKKGATDASFSEDITISQEFTQIDGRAFLHLEAGQGGGLTDELSLYSNVNGDAFDDNNVTVSEIWYEQEFLNHKAMLTFGKLDATVYFDDNKVANDETVQFLSDMFINNPAVEFPDYTLGLRAAVLPVDWLEINYGVFDAESDWDNIADNLFSIGQVTLKTDFFELPGNYRFLGWHSRARHAKWLDPEKEKEKAYGFALSFDQKANDIVTLFARYGWQDPKVFNPDITASADLNYSLKHSWSAGLQIEGKPWHRENDIVGLAIGQAIPSGDYRRAFDPELNAKKEGHFEAYYSLRLNDHLSVSPDFQYIWNPFGKDITGDTAGICVYGVRTQVDF